ncbi:MAG TPA: efflux RND transporter periplasmic adaptor subunit [Leptolyngbyaceae cyanobacterium M33_DOE_097]|uniref:Efflux RND transporter periplasmic adaptor subunit n=1 Tax=Oscillatoriales cyanobacterium SpSt-418 TaxID=2282169 RepID=A0A7C3PMR1_9CYAN|nr:efflux RND transporter periplasmic adaptor subunit [Leptolyngbyaceae cyanobacterium M33_DOE_097]
MFISKFPDLKSLQWRRSSQVVGSALLLGVLAATSGCQLLPKSQVAKAQSNRPGGNQGPPAVDAMVARTAQLQQGREYTGTTQAIREVAIRSQVEGQLLDLAVDIGDAVRQGQVIAQLDDNILTSDVTSAESELSARRAEIARLQTQVSEAQKQVRQAELQLRQARSDANRYRQLASQGAIAVQQAEQAETEARTAAEVLRSTIDQVNTRRQEIEIAEERLRSQRAVINQARQRRNYARVTSPVNGFVTAKTNEAGNFLQPGTEIVKVGDFSNVKVVVQVSDLDLRQIRQEQSAKVQFDAIPNQEFTGTVLRISPAANPTSRLSPVEIVVPNTSRRLGSGLLARVTFASTSTSKVIVPLSALRAGQPRNAGQQGGQAAQGGAPTGGDRTNAGAGTNAGNQPKQGKIFTVTGEGDQASVASRTVTLGQQLDGRVEILSGLRPGDRFIARSSGPLKDGDTVRLSILSEDANRRSKQAN